jgi:hypothetical protein
VREHVVARASLIRGGARRRLSELLPLREESAGLVGLALGSEEEDGDLGVEEPTQQSTATLTKTRTAMRQQDGKERAVRP